MSVPGGRDQAFEPPCLRFKCGSAGVGQPVVSAPRVIERAVRSVTHFLDERRRQQSFDRTVQRARSHLQRAASLFGDIQHNPVAVSLALGQGKQNMENSWSQRRIAADAIFSVQGIYLSWMYLLRI